MNSEDRALLDLAARASGVDIIWATDRSCCFLLDPWDGQPNCDDPWNPLSNDGDALRLAVKLDLSIAVEVKLHSDVIVAYHTGIEEPSVASLDEPTGDDPYAATRRAIVRAAAEIGRRMP